MKTASTPVLPFSGSVLTVLESGRTKKQESLLKMVKKEEHTCKYIALPGNKTVNDPANWDESWFANYE